jgi:adenylosuccinate synthase
MDVLDTLEKIKIGVAYKYRGKILHDLPMDLCDIQECEPIYETMPGWQSETFGATRFDQLPQNAKNYIARLEALCGVSFDIISTGPSREQTIVLKNIISK